MIDFILGQINFARRKREGLRESAALNGRNTDVEYGGEPEPKSVVQRENVEKIIKNAIKNAPMVL